MALINSKFGSVLLLILLIAVAARQTQAQGGSCAAELSHLNICAPYVLPGSGNANPGADCCGALGSVNHECLCNTLRISAQLPTRCNLPPLNCPN